MIIKYVVSVRRHDGISTFLPFHIECAHAQFEDGVSEHEAYLAAEDLGYDEVGLIYNEFDGPDWLFDQFDWKDVKLCTISEDNY